jgi:hypothetical protein
VGEKKYLFCTCLNSGRIHIPHMGKKSSPYSYPSDQIPIDIRYAYPNYIPSPALTQAHLSTSQVAASREKKHQTPQSARRSTDASLSFPPQPRKLFSSPSLSRVQKKVSPSPPRPPNPQIRRFSLPPKKISAVHPTLRPPPSRAQINSGRARVRCRTPHRHPLPLSSAQAKP